MSTLIKKIEINNRELQMVYADGQWWIAVKPICEALGVDYSRQLRTLKSDVFLGSAWSLKTMQVGIQKREIVCLPERFIYGWIFSLNSNSELLAQYKMKCYEVLYEHFHGALSQRANLLKEKTLKQLRVDELKKKIEASEDYRYFQQLKKEISEEKKELNKLDSSFVSEQLELWTLEESDNENG